MRRTEKERIISHQKTDINILDWLLAIDFDVGQTGGEPNR
jgi:hypothetical protein